MTEEGTALTAPPIALMEAPARSLCRPCDCPTFRCRFTVARVRFYCHVYRQAHLAREPFEAVLRSEARESRMIDPWVRGRKHDPDDARDIGIALEVAAREHGIPINAHNAERLASVLCPERCGEAPVDNEEPETRK